MNKTTTEAGAQQAKEPPTKFVVNEFGVVSEVPADWVGDATFKPATPAQVTEYKATTAPAPTPEAAPRVPKP